MTPQAQAAAEAAAKSIDHQVVLHLISNAPLIIAAVAGLIGVLGVLFCVLLVLRMSVRNGMQLKQLHLATNSRLDLLLEKQAESSHAKGVVEGLARAGVIAEQSRQDAVSDKYDLDHDIKPPDNRTAPGSAAATVPAPPNEPPLTTDAPVEPPLPSALQAMKTAMGPTSQHVAPATEPGSTLPRPIEPITRVVEIRLPGTIVDPPPVEPIK